MRTFSLPRPNRGELEDGAGRYPRISERTAYATVPYEEPGDTRVGTIELSSPSSAPAGTHPATRY